MKSRAYSTWKAKAIKDDAGIMRIEGLASTPKPDRDRDIMEPKGAVFKLPIPLIWQHDHGSPIGIVTSAVRKEEGIYIKAEVKQFTARLEVYAEMIRQKLVRGLSVGFRALKHAMLDNGGVHFMKWELYEISTVTVPANADATIQVVKSMDAAVRKVTGKHAGEKPEDIAAEDLRSDDLPNITKAKNYLQKMENILK
jgi:HK97 family phage prohead protease